ncbi:MAG: TraB/GumN family protein [Pseudomonadota bacterium]|nr:TraB/GumN family protein [Pseudomonadota bacterium]
MRVWSGITLFFFTQCAGTVYADVCPPDLQRTNHLTTRELHMRHPDPSLPIFMWRYRSLESDLYLVGSVHALKASLRPLPDQLEHAFRQSTHLAVEVDTTRTNPLDPAWINEHLFLPNDTFLTSLLNEARRKRLSCVLKQTNIDYASIRRFKPALAAMQISRARLSNLGYQAEWGTEQRFLRRAGNREVVELESPQEQLLLITDPSLAVQLEMLDESLVGYEEFSAELVSLMSAWLAGDDETIAQLFGNRKYHSSDYREFQYRLLNQRNVGFTQKIESYLASPGTYFVIVGAAHLGGSQGVVRLLDASGHKGHRVSSMDRFNP